MQKQFTALKFSNLSVLGVCLFVFCGVNWRIAIANECGTVNIPKGLPVEGNQTREGFWPFAVAIYKVPRIFCTGSLISRRHVLTGI